MDRAAANNPDGFGYAYASTARNGTQRVIVRKAARYAELKEKFQRDYARHRAHTPFLIHFRWATHGIVAQRTAHPFALADGGAMIHNGIIDMPVSRNGQSDTEALVAKFLNRLPVGWETSATMVAGVERMIEHGNKLAFIWPDKRTLIIGEKQGFWYENIWYSNSSHKTMRSTYYQTNDEAFLPGGTHRVWQSTRPLFVGNTGVHSVNCTCEPCKTYDDVNPEDEVKFTEFVVKSLTDRAHHLGGDKPDWATPVGITSSLNPIVLKVADEKALLPRGVYVATKDRVYIVPAALHGASTQEIYLWYVKTPRTQSQPFKVMVR